MKNTFSSIVGLSALLLSGHTLAQDFYASDSLEFRTALFDASNTNESNTIYLAAGVYKTTDDFGGTFISPTAYKFNLIIRGEDRDSTVLDGDGLHDVLIIENSRKGVTSTTLENLTIQNGLRGVNFESMVTGIVKNSVIQNNSLTSSSYGAGIEARDNLVLESTLIRNNSISRQYDSRGAGVYASGDITMTDSEISGNEIVSDGLMLGAGLYSQKSIESYSSIIKDNRLVSSEGDVGTGLGGGVYATTGASLWDTEVSGNKMVGLRKAYGAGVSVGSGLAQVVSNSRIEGNLFVSDGGLVLQYQGAGFYSKSDYRFDNTLFIGNGSPDYSGVQGAALYTERHLGFVNGAIVNSVGGSTVYSISSSPTAVIANTLFTGNEGEEIVANQFNVIHNFIDMANTDITNPFFIGNINSGDLLLDGDTFQAGDRSVLIDAGINDTGLFNLPEKDYLGYRRVFNTVADIGPYEFGADTLAPLVSATVTGELKVTKELTFNISAEASEGRTITSYEIDYGFGEFNDVIEISAYSYGINEPGTYSVIVRVTDSEGDSSEWSDELVIVDLAIEDKLELAKQEGFAEGVDDVTDNLAEYGLTTEEDKDVALLAAQLVAQTDKDAALLAAQLIAQTDKEAALLAAQTDKEAALLAAQLIAQADKDAVLLAAQLVAQIDKDAALLAAQLIAQTDKDAAILAAIKNVSDNPQGFGLISLDDVQAVTTDLISNLNSGSHLIGTGNTITDFSIFDSVVLVWAYQDGKYKAYASNVDLRQTVINAGYEELTTIEASTGFWVIKE